MLLTSLSTLPLLAVVIGALVHGVDSFRSPSTRLASQNRLGSTTIGMARSRAMPDIVDEDEDGVNRILVRNVDREWTWDDDYVADGDFDVDVFVPNGKVKGCVFFMHGFSQYPIAYRKTLKKTAENANVAIIACTTGLVSGIVLKDVGSKPLSFITDRDWPQFALQRALSQDTKQCIQMVLKNDQVFKELGITRNLPLGLCGHSMGGGLCFTVAKDFPQIQHIFSMAPVAGVDPFGPLSAMQDRTVDNSMLLAGKWDLLAKADKVASMSVESNKQNPNSSILVDVQRGLHTGFQDKLVLFDVPIINGLGPLAIVLDFIGFGELILLNIVALLRTDTGQLAGTRSLMEYFFGQMASKKDISIEGAEKCVAESVKEKWEDKFEIKIVE